MDVGCQKEAIIKTLPNPINQPPTGVPILPDILVGEKKDLSFEWEV